MVSGIQWWTKVFVIIIICFSHINGMENEPNKMTINMAEFVAEKFQELVNQTNIEFQQTFTPQEILQILQENVNKETNFSKESQFEEKNRLLKTVEKINLEKNTKNLVPIEKLHSNDWYQIMEFLGVHQVFSPLARTNKNIYQMIQKLMHEGTTMFLEKLLHIPMTTDMIEGMAKYCSNDVESTTIHFPNENFFILWNKLFCDSEHLLLTKPIVFSLEKHKVDFISFPDVFNRHRYRDEMESFETTYYDYLAHKLINSSMRYIPEIPMFYHFILLYDLWKIDIWFRIDDIIYFGGETNHWYYHLKFARKSVIIDLVKFKLFGNVHDKKWYEIIVYREGKGSPINELHAEISNTFAFFYNKI